MLGQLKDVQSTHKDVWSTHKDIGQLIRKLVNS